MEKATAAISNEQQQENEKGIQDLTMVGRNKNISNIVSEQSSSNIQRLKQCTMYEFCGTKKAVMEITQEEGQVAEQQDTSRNEGAPQQRSANSDPWGDKHVPGSQVKRMHIFRVVSHNVNGLSMANEHEDVRRFAKTMQDKGVAVFGIQETNRNFERHNMVHSFHNIIKGTSTHHRGAVSSARLGFNSNYQPGGTAVSVRNEWATRFLNKGSDDIGRWSWLTLVGRGNTKVTFISGYRVCEGATEAALPSKTVRAQQEWIYADRGAPSVDLRDQFVKDLGKMIRNLQVQGHDIVLMIDANEGIGHGTGVDQILHSCNLVDAHSLAQTLIAPPPTYQRGTKKIDYIMISPRLVHAVRAVSILAPHDGYLSDHRSLVVDFDARTLFEGVTSQIMASATRRLTSTNPRAVHEYTTQLLKYYETHDILKRVTKLQAKSDKGSLQTGDVAEWEILDRLITEGRRSAENKCAKKRSGQLPWSPELERAGLEVLYWKMRQRAFSGGVLNAEISCALAQRLSIPEQERGNLTYQQVTSEDGRHREKGSAPTGNGQTGGVVAFNVGGCSAVKHTGSRKGITSVQRIEKGVWWRPLRRL